MIKWLLNKREGTGLQLLFPDCPREETLHCSLA